MSKERNVLIVNLKPIVDYIRSDGINNLVSIVGEESLLQTIVNYEYKIVCDIIDNCVYGLDDNFKQEILTKNSIKTDIITTGFDDFVTNVLDIEMDNAIFTIKDMYTSELRKYVKHKNIEDFKIITPVKNSNEVYAIGTIDVQERLFESEFVNKYPMF